MQMLHFFPHFLKSEMNQYHKNLQNDIWLIEQFAKICRDLHQGVECQTIFFFVLFHASQKKAEI